jgi:hypothetical protein
MALKEELVDDSPNHLKDELHQQEEHDLHKNKERLEDKVDKQDKKDKHDEKEDKHDKQDKYDQPVEKDKLNQNEYDDHLEEVKEKDVLLKNENHVMKGKLDYQDEEEVVNKEKDEVNEKERKEKLNADDKKQEKDLKHGEDENKAEQEKQDKHERYDKQDKQEKLDKQEKQDKQNKQEKLDKDKLEDQKDNKFINKQPVSKLKKPLEKSKTLQDSLPSSRRTKSAIIPNFEKKLQAKKEVKPVNTIGNDRFKSLLSMFDRKTPSAAEQNTAKQVGKLDNSKFDTFRGNKAEEASEANDKQYGVKDGIKSRVENLLKNNDNKPVVSTSNYYDPVLEGRRVHKEKEVEEDVVEEDNEDLEIGDDSDNEQVGLCD